jgi:hypothetical protein
MFSGIAHAEEPVVIAPGADTAEAFKLTKLDISPASPALGAQGIIAGRVVINHTTREVTATFYKPAPKCGPGMICPRYLYAPVTIELPID